jgi:hypothetical protein
MEAIMRHKSLLAVMLVTVANACHLPAQNIQLSIQPRGTDLELRWPGSVVLQSGRKVYPLFQLEQSVDLRNWQPVGPVIKGGGDLMSTLMPPGALQSFYRLGAQWEQNGAQATATGGAEVFGYEAAFQRELQRLGPLSTAEFRSRYGLTNEYLSTFSWDPTTALYWNLFATDPFTNNVGLSRTNKGYRLYDYRLDVREMAVLRRNGFVVSERLATDSFAESFYRLWNDDLPVFISTDAFLQAWHRSYDNMLIELEHFWLYYTAGEILNGMAAQITAARQEAAGGPLEQSVLDADYFLTVARSLYSNSIVPSALGQDTRVRQTWDLINAEQLACFTLFDYPRWVDFSQFKPRGHYTESERLQHYFRTVMWLGRTDLRIAGKDSDCDGNELPPSRRQLGTAIVLGRLLALANQFDNWQQFERVIQTFVGMTDSMTFAQLADLTEAAGIRTLRDVPTAEKLAQLQEEIEAGTLGVQNIGADVIVSPLGPAQVRLPRSFTVFGQKFVLDSWVFSQVVFDRILHAEGKVRRRVPGCFDVAFAALKNDVVVSELVARIENTAARQSANHTIQWRDGFPYQHNLAAARNVIDSQDAASWEHNIYTSWLGTLRQLSTPTTDSRYPEAMRNRAWALRTLNTQLASWTQLRHDTILYAKQSYTFPGVCEYPDGYVEPQVPFWRALERMALRTAELLASLPGGQIPYSESVWDPERTIDLGVIRSSQVRFLTNFAARTAQLREIAEQELRQESLTPQQLRFIDTMMQDTSTGYTQVRLYNGWYPALYYRMAYAVGRGWDFFDNYPVNFGATKFDALIADVHTDSPDPLDTGDPGGILHQAVGKVHLLYIAVDSGSGRTMYAGPILSHYEFETPFPTRLTDIEWKERLKEAVPPAHPPWTQSFLVPAQ